MGSEGRQRGTEAQQTDRQRGERALTSTCLGGAAGVSAGGALFFDFFADVDVAVVGGGAASSGRASGAESSPMCSTLR